MNYIKFILIIFILYLYLYLYLYYTQNIYNSNFNITTKKLKNPIQELANYNPNIYKAYNSSVFIYNNKIYNTFRLASVNFNLHKLYEHITQTGYTYPSKICIQSSDITSEILMPDITYLKKYLHLTKNKKYKSTGYQDARSVVINNYLYLIITVFVESIKYSQIGIIKINCNKLNDKYIIPDDFNLVNPSYLKDGHQKNWMPFVYNSQLYLVYSINPHKILHCDLNTYNLTEISNVFNNKIPKNIRGGSNIILYNSNRFKNVYLGLGHIKRNMFYTHIFYIFNCEYPFQVIGISNEFIIGDNKLKFLKTSKEVIPNLLKYKWNIQFVAGLCMIDSHLKIYYGQDDEYSMEFTINKNNLDSIINLI